MNMRAATHDDLSAALQLLDEAKLPIDGVADHFGDGYVVAEDTAVVGLAGVEVYDVDGLLRSVVVHSARRGSGLGAELVLNRVEWARSRGLRDVYLLTETAHDFFQKLGFVDTERGAAPPAMQLAPEFAHLCPSSSVTMRLRLT